MKKMIVSIALQFISFFGSAYSTPSVLNVRLQSNRPFTVQFDNQRFEVPDVNYSIRGIEPGNHFLTISRTRVFAGYPFPQRYVVFAGYVNIPCASVVQSIVRSYDRIDFVRIDPIFQAPPIQPQFQFQQPVLYSEYNPVVPMCENDFIGISSMLRQQAFESSRFEIARKVLAQKNLSTDQVVSLMQLFDFDSTRLAFAKFAYSRTIDRGNYYKTFTALDFDSSVQELSNYIARPS